MKQSEYPQNNQRPSQKKSKQKKVGNYMIYLDQLLGKGAFANVYLGEDNMTKEQVAIKEISNKILVEKLGEKRGMEGLERELQISEVLNHKNIVKLHKFYKTENNNYFIFEYCAGGDLRQFLKDRKFLSEIITQRFMKQIADALKVMYYHNIIHRDLKLQNILITDKSDNAIIKLADFGLAKQFESEEQLYDTIVGTPIYMSPEIQKGEKYTDKADLWSIGVILYELLIGQPPFTGKNRYELLQNINQGKVVVPNDIQISPLCLDLILKLLRADPSQRMTWKDFFQHSFIACDQKMYPQIYKEIMADQKKLVKKKEEIKSIQQEQLVYNETNKVQNKRYDQVIDEQNISTISQDVESKIKLNQGDPDNNSNSYTQEDLEEALDDIYNVMKAIIDKGRGVELLYQDEISSKITQEPYQFSDEFNFIVFKILLQIKYALQLTIIIKEQQQINQVITLRIYTINSKEIRINQFLIEKLQEKIGFQLFNLIQQYDLLISKLMGYLHEFSYRIDNYDMVELPKKLINYGIEVYKQGEQERSFFNYKKSQLKYDNSLFIINENIREAYLSLKFSNQEQKMEKNQSNERKEQSIIISFAFVNQIPQLKYEKQMEGILFKVKKLIENSIQDIQKYLV